MKLAIMQPYLFPYLGYFQLLNSVDLFVVYDDVQFIRNGWINRNNILVQGRPYRFTLPVSGGSRSRKINEVSLPDNQRWVADFLKTITRAYPKAPYLAPTADLVEKTFSIKTDLLIDVLKRSLALVCGYLAITTPIDVSSQRYRNQEKTKAQRLLDICKAEGASDYYNLPGGKGLYDKILFHEQNVNLSFLEYQPKPYDQGSPVFVPSLSILDVLMFNSPQTIKKTMLLDYVLT